MSILLLNPVGADEDSSEPWARIYERTNPTCVNICTGKYGAMDVNETRLKEGDPRYTKLMAVLDLLGPNHISEGKRQWILPVEEYRALVEKE